MNVTFFPSVPAGLTAAPASKSHAIRLLIAASLADKPTVIRSPGFSDDVTAARAMLIVIARTINALNHLMERKLAGCGLQDRVSCEQGDSEAMRFESGSIDVATIAFGIRNFEHRETALREILRVLKTGGRLVILELSVPSNAFLRWCYNIYFTRILPVIGGRISGDRSAYRYLPASVLNFPPKAEWMETMRACGFTGVRHRAFTLGICRMYVGVKP